MMEREMFAVQCKLSQKFIFVIAAYFFLNELLLFAPSPLNADDTSTKSRSVFYPQDVLTTIQSNIKKYEWSAEALEDCINAAEQWKSLSNVCFDKHTTI